MAGRTDRSVRGVITRLVLGACGILATSASAPGLEPVPTSARAEVDTTGAAAPLPGAQWNDPDSVNWVEPPPGSGHDDRPRLRITERLGDARPRSGRIIDLLRNDAGSGRRVARTTSPGAVAAPASLDPAAARWPDPTHLESLLEQVTASCTAQDADPIRRWVVVVREDLAHVASTGGPRSAAATDALLRLGEDAEAGLHLADASEDATLAAATRRAALAVGRRVTVWRAAAAACSDAATVTPSPGFAGLAEALAPAGLESATARLLLALETFETDRAATSAADVRAALADLTAYNGAAPRAATEAVTDHYLAPNVRVTVHERLVARMLPTATVTTGPLHDFILGRPVRGTSTVEQSIGLRFVPDPDAIRVELLVNGEVASRTVTDSGPVSFHSRGAATFTVRKPIVVSTAGVDVGAALGTASNQTRLATIQTSFDSVPIMGSLVRSIARSQHDEHRQAAAREVNQRIIVRACREVDRQAEPQFSEAAERIRARVWEPLVRLGLEPTPVVLSTSADVATARLRLAGPEQLAAHTPRPRAPEDAVLAVQVHESAANNACARLALAGRRLALEELVTTLCERLGIEPRIPDDLPENVTICFATEEPLRVACRDGLIHLTVTLDALESTRRDWFDIVAHVAYRPVAEGMQVRLEREGPVQLSGPGHQGRLEIALRTIFGKIFPKERRIPLLPETFVTNPRLADLRAVQAVATDGWLAIALVPTTMAGGPSQPTTATQPPPQRRLLRR